jgi:hypothetical protein
VEQAFRPFKFINAGGSHGVEQAFRPAVRLQSNSALAAEVKKKKKCTKKPQRNIA